MAAKSLQTPVKAVLHQRFEPGPLVEVGRRERDVGSVDPCLAQGPLLGCPGWRFVDLEDSRAAFRQIRSTVDRAVRPRVPGGTEDDELLDRIRCFGRFGNRPVEEVRAMADEGRSLQVLHRRREARQQTPSPGGSERIQA